MASQAVPQPEKKKNFGKAEYAAGRNRKSKILVYTSKTNRSKVYEFMIAAKFKTPGLVSWKCVSCSKIKNDYRNLGEKLERKVPLILVDNDIIREDPEKPLNAPHFCSGKDAVESVVNRSELKFLADHQYIETEKESLQETISNFSKKVIESSQIPLTLKEKKIVKKTLDVRCFTLFNDVRKRKLKKEYKQACLNANAELQGGAGPSTSNTISNNEEVNEAEDVEIDVEHVDEELYEEYEQYEEEPRNMEPMYIAGDKNSQNYYCQSSEARPPNEEESESPPDCKKRKTCSPELVFVNTEDIILGNSQDVAYDIELG